MASHGESASWSQSVERVVDLRGGAVQRVPLEAEHGHKHWIGRAAERSPFPTHRQPSPTYDAGWQRSRGGNGQLWAPRHRVPLDPLAVIELPLSLRPFARHGFLSVAASGSADPFTELFSRLFGAWALVLDGEPIRGLTELEQLENDLTAPAPFVLDLYLQLLHALTLVRVNRVDDAMDHVARGLAIWERDYAHLEERLMYPLAAAMVTADAAGRNEFAAFLSGFSQSRVPLLIEMLVPILDEIDQLGATLDAETRGRCRAEGAAAEVTDVVARIHDLVGDRAG